MNADQMQAVRDLIEFARADGDLEAVAAADIAETYLNNED